MTYHPFCHDIANAFFRAGMIESWGRGIERIMDACKTAGVPAPKLRHESTGLWIEFPLKKPASQRKSSVKTPVKTPVKILQLLKKNPNFTLADLAASIGKSVSATERASLKLVKEGKLRRIGPAKGGNWEVLE